MPKMPICWKSRRDKSPYGGRSPSLQKLLKTKLHEEAPEKNNNNNQLRITEKLWLKVGGGGYSSTQASPEAKNG